MNINLIIKNLLVVLPVTSTLTLSGCAANGMVMPTTKMANVDFKFIGIPGLLSVQGSAVRIDEEWLLTAKHNASFLLFDEVYEHPDCDIALIKDKGKIAKPLNMRLVGHTEKLTHKGYAGFFAIPSKGRGEFLQYLTTNNCTVGLSDAPIWQGMSGGAVYNSNKELVGINSAIIRNIELNPGSAPLKDADRRTAYVPVCSKEVGEWMESVTNKNYCDNYKNITAILDLD